MAIEYVTILDADGNPQNIAVDTDGDGNHVQIMKIAGETDGETTAITPLTNTQLRAADVKVSLDSEAVVLGAGSAAIGKLAANSGVDIGDVTINNASDIPVTLDGESVGVTGPLTDTELRASDVKVTLDGESVAVTGTVTANTGLTQPLTDTQLRATAVPVSLASVPSHAVTGPLTDTELRATAVPVSGTVTAELSATDNAVLDDILTTVTNIQVNTNVLPGVTASDGPDELRVDIIDPLPAGTALIGKVGIDQATANANEVVVKSGTVTANLGATDNAVLDDIAAKLATIDADTSTLAAAVSTEVQVDVVGALPAGTNNIGDVDVLSIAAGDNNIGNVDVATIAAGETHIGSVGSPDIVITVDATPDTSALADGDVAFATQEVANAARVNAGTTILQSVTIADVDDQKKAIDLIFFDANTTLGTENSAPDIDDTEVQTVLGRVSIAEADYYDLGANSVACVTGIGLVMKAGAATTSLYVAGIARGAPTYAGGHLYIKLGFLRN